MQYAETIVVGAGVAGLAAAQTLLRMGRSSVLLLEKSRGVGGRVATRQWRVPRGTSASGDGTEGGDYTVAGWMDTGPQYLQWRTDAFHQRLRDWEARGWLKEVHGRGYTAALQEGLNGWARRAFDADALVAEGRVLLQHSVKSLQWLPERRKWHVSAQAPNSVKFEARCKHIIVTPPIPQTRKLLESYLVMEDVEYEACCALLVYLPDQTTPAFEGTRDVNTSILRTLTSQQSFGRMRHGQGETIVAHAQPGWSAHQRLRLADAEQELWQHVRSYVGQHLPHLMPQLTTAQTQLKWWRYAQPKASLESAFLPIWEPGKGKRSMVGVVCGDAFAGGRVEGAIVSAEKAVEELWRE